MEEIGSNDYSLLLGIHNFQNKARSSVPFPMRHKNNIHDDNIKNNNLNSDLNKLKTVRTLPFDKETNCYDDNNNKKKLFKELYDCDDGGILSSNEDKIYYLGIIDILTEYGMVKKAEHLCKMIRYCSENMSCIPPKKYKERFINYMKNTVFDNREFLRKVPINDDVDKNIAKNLCCSQNLNNELYKINKNQELNEDNKSDNPYNNNYNTDWNNKTYNRNNTNINSEESDHRFNIRKNSSNNTDNR